MRGRDTRVRVLLWVVITVVAVGGIFSLMPGAGVEVPAAATEAVVSAPNRIGDTVYESGEEAGQKGPENMPGRKQSELDQRFSQGVMMLHSGRFEYAAAAFHRVLQLAPRMPEAHVNMGYSLLGLQRHSTALDFFLTAVELRPEQVNAYYGLALALERACDIPAARGAMRTYLHLADGQDRYLSKARAALWEWEAWQGDCDSARPVDATVGSGQ